MTCLGRTPLLGSKRLGSKRLGSKRRFNLNAGYLLWRPPGISCAAVLLPTPAYLEPGASQSETALAWPGGRSRTGHGPVTDRSRTGHGPVEPVQALHRMQVTGTGQTAEAHSALPSPYFPLPSNLRVSS